MSLEVKLGQAWFILGWETALENQEKQDARGNCHGSVVKDAMPDYLKGGSPTPKYCKME